LRRDIPGTGKGACIRYFISKRGLCYLPEPF
jgi:hypothetical protein